MRGFRSCFTPLTGVLFTFRSRYCALSVAEEYLALGGGPPGFRPGFTCPTVLGNSLGRAVPFAYGAITRYGAAFQKLRLGATFLTPAGVQKRRA